MVSVDTRVRCRIWAICRAK